MKKRSLTLVLASVWLISACGARTSEDELLGYQGGHSASGGRTGSGGASGGTGGGPVSSGGASNSGGTNATGGTAGSGGTTGVGGSTGGTGGAFPGNLCCKEHDDPGCNITFIEECVCELDDYCCDKSWDRRCVNTAHDSCLGQCFGTGSGGGSTGGAPGVGGSSGGSGGISSGGTGSGGAPAGNCCSVHESPGCQNMEVTSCVCAFDDFCCENYWDNYCVQEAQSYCKADCGMGGGAGGAPMGTGGSNFCDFAGDCGSCTCDSCGDEMEACQKDSGCLSIAWCVQGSGCLPFDCYKPETCQEVIDKAGGLSSDSTQLAIRLSACVISANCPCQ